MRCCLGDDARFYYWRSTSSRVGRFGLVINSRDFQIKSDSLTKSNFHSKSILENQRRQVTDLAVD